MIMESKAPRVGHKKSRKGCAQCKRRHVKCNEETPCSNCVRHGVLCSLAGGPQVQREDARPRHNSNSKSNVSNSPTRTSESPSTSACSPFSVLTGLIDRPQPGEEKSWARLDMELMHHYMAHTKAVLTEHADLEFVIRIWKEELPRVAFGCDYVMHGLLGLTALHKASLEPGMAGMLQTAAVDHLDKALVLYRRDGGFDEERANAKFVFTWLVALFAYAIPPSVPPIDAVGELMQLVKGIEAVLAETWYFVAQGPFATILSRGFQEARPVRVDGYVWKNKTVLTMADRGRTYGLPENMDFGISHLDFMLGVDVMLPDDRRICVLVLSELKAIYDSVRNDASGGSCSVASILCFPKADSTAFANLIKRRVPQALVILSYYCVMLDLLNDRWWISGWAERVLTDVLACLDESWRHWVEWPCESVLWKKTDPSAMIVA